MTSPTPIPTVTVTATVTAPPLAPPVVIQVGGTSATTAPPAPSPAGDSLFYDKLQGWGTMLAAIIALVVAVISLLQRRTDGQAARVQDRRDFLIKQLQDLSEIAHDWAMDRAHHTALRERLRGRLLLVPETYATLLRRQVQMGNRPIVRDVGEEFLRKLLRPDQLEGLQPSQFKSEWIQAELADNIADLIGGVDNRPTFPLDGATEGVA